MHKSSKFLTLNKFFFQVLKKWVNLAKQQGRYSQITILLLVSFTLYLVLLNLSFICLIDWEETKAGQVSQE